jgi:hypothetical protein
MVYPTLNFQNKTAHGVEAEQRENARNITLIARKTEIDIKKLL